MNPTNPTLAYVVSGFPLTTETFILREVVELTRLGWPIELFSIRHPREQVVHPEARWLERRVHYPDWHAMLAGNYALLGRHRMSGRACSPPRSAVPPARRLLRPVTDRFSNCHRLGQTDAAAGRSAYSCPFRHVPGISRPACGTDPGHWLQLYGSRARSLRRQCHARGKGAAGCFVVTISEFNRQRLCALSGAASANRVLVVRCGVPVGTYTFTPRPPASAGGTC